MQQQDPVARMRANVVETRRIVKRRASSRNELTELDASVFFKLTELREL